MEGTLTCRQRVRRGREAGLSGREGEWQSRQARLLLQVVWDSPRSRQAWRLSGAHLPGRPWGSWTGVMATGLGMERRGGDRGQHPGDTQTIPSVTTA